MRLVELEPRWIHPNVFIFRCPHCREVFLACKSAPMPEREQHRLYETALGEEWNLLVVPSRPDFAWTIHGGDFNTISVWPSIDASRSGHWHGFIANGEIK